MLRGHRQDGRRLYFGLIFLQPGSVPQGRIFLSISNCHRSKSAAISLFECCELLVHRTIERQRCWGGKKERMFCTHGPSCWPYKDNGIYLIAFKSWCTRTGHQCKSFTYRGNLYLLMGGKSISIPCARDPSLNTVTCRRKKRNYKWHINLVSLRGNLRHMYRLSIYPMQGVYCQRPVRKFLRL